MNMQEQQGKQEGSQNDELGIKIRSNDNPYLSVDIQSKLLQPRKLASYFIVLIENGSITYNLDSKDFTLTDGHLLFAMPNQIFTPPAKPDRNTLVVKITHKNPNYEPPTAYSPDEDKPM